ncbi:MAG TPA: tetratricopeptide repeat protein [Ktedonobacterales bacterium]
MSAPIPTPFGVMLRRYRLAAGLTQGALAERAGLSERAVNDLERAPHRTPRLETVTLLAAALGLAADDRARLLAAARPSSIAPEPPATPAHSDSPVETTLATRALDPVPLRIAPLPAPPDRFIGREREIAELDTLLRDPDTRLLTLTGPGGIGKTRLALRVAGELADVFPDGVYFVALDTITDPALVLRTVAATLGIRESAFETPAVQLAEALQKRRTLLILDNFEQALSAAIDIERLLAACPLVTALVTSRSLLRLSREHEYVVPPLALPEQASALAPDQLLRYDSIALLIQSARAGRADFALTEANAGAVVSICLRLDGIPLAIQLAAARIRHLSPAQLLARLDQQLTVLTGGPRDAPERQRTVRATLDWSYYLLAPAQQTLLRRLAVFAGGWTLEAAEEVCTGEGVAREDVLDLIGALVDHSFVRVEERDGDTRYRMLEPIRQYSEEKLREAGEESHTRDRHLAWILAAGERLASATWIMPPWHEARLARHEGDNLRAAIAWSRRDTSGQLTLRLAGSTHALWAATGMISEGRQTLRDALANVDPQLHSYTRARALTTATNLAGVQTDLAEIESLALEAMENLRSLGDERAIAHFRAAVARAITRTWPTDQVRFSAAREESLEISRAYGGPRALAESLYFWADLAVDRGEYAEARRELEESMRLCEQAQDTYLITFPLTTLARVACAEGNVAQARAYAEQAFSLRQRQGWGWLHAVAYNSLGEVERYAQNDARAAELFAEAFIIFQAGADEPGLAWTRHNLGHIALRAGEVSRAAERFTQALTARHRHRYPLGIAAELAALASVADATGRATLGARIGGATQALLDSIHYVLAPADLVIFEQTVAALRAELEPSAFAAAWAEGGALNVEGAITEALRMG